MLSPAIITLPWRPDAAEHYFAPLSALPWAMLLHSGFADHPHNRFDILVAAPRATLLTRGEQTWVDDGETVVVSAEDPLQLLQQQLDRQPFTPQPHDDLPFLGGALGLFGYDLGRRFERLPSHAQADIALADMAVRVYPRRQDITGYELADGRTLNLLAEGRLVNLASGNGHPAEIMDTSFSVQALALEYLLHHASELGKQVYDIPEEIDREVSRLKLHGAGLRIDTLTPEQEAYLSGWQV